MPQVDVVSKFVDVWRCEQALQVWGNLIMCRQSAAVRIRSARTLEHNIFFAWLRRVEQSHWCKTKAAAADVRRGVAITAFYVKRWKMRRSQVYGVHYCTKVGMAQETCVHKVFMEVEEVWRDKAPIL